MTRAVVDPSPAPTLFRSLVTGEVVHIDDLDECHECGGPGTIPHYERVRVDDRGWKMAVEYTTCGSCGGNGLVEPLRMHGGTVLGRVEPLVGTK